MTRIQRIGLIGAGGAGARGVPGRVEAGDPSRVIVTYDEALRTDRLTRAAVAAGG